MAEVFHSRVNDAVKSTAKLFLQQLNGHFVFKGLKFSEVVILCKIFKKP